MQQVHKGLAVAAVLLVGVATSLESQQHRQHGQQGMHGQMQQGQHGMMMGRMGVFSPKRLLEHKDDLQLTDEQVAQLTTLREETAATVEQVTQSHDAHRAQLMEAMTAETVDRNAVLSHMEAAHAAMGTARRTELQSLFRAMDILTAEQRDVVKGWATTQGPSRQTGQGQRQGGGCCTNR